MRKFIYITGGCLAVTLGVIGIFVPGLPTTPFLLLASWLFYQSSARLHKKLNESWLGKYIRRYQSKAGVSLLTKLTSIGCMLFMLSISICFFIEQIHLKYLVALLGFIGTCCILFLVPGEKKNTKTENLQQQQRDKGQKVN